jgi:hypothetical protein
MKKSLKFAHGLAGAAALLSSGVARAHEGHGLAGAHWHATDTWGFLCVALLAALALWSSRGK